MINEKDILYKKLLKKSFFFLKYRQRSEKEIKDNLVRTLKKHKVSIPNQESVINKVIAKLKSLKLVNDSQFAESFIEYRLKIKPKARRIIVQELKNKGIDSELIEKLTKIYFTSENQTELLKNILAKRAQRLKNIPNYEKKLKLTRYGLSKGFEYDDIRNVIDEITLEGVK